MKLFFYLILILVPFVCNAYEFGAVVVNCGSEKKCEELKESLSELVGQKYQEYELNKTLATYLLDSAIKSFSYKVLKADGIETLVVDVRYFKVIKSIDFQGIDELHNERFENILSYKVGGYYNEQDIQKTIGELKEYLSKRGLSNADIKFVPIVDGNRIKIRYIITVGEMLKIDDIIILTPSLELRTIIKRRFSELIGTHWDKIDFKKKQDLLEREYFNQGYFFSRFVSLTPEIRGNKVILRVQVELGRRFHYDFQGNKIFSRQELSGFLKQLVKKQLGRFEEKELSTALIKKYEDLGVYNTVVDVRAKQGVTKFGVPFTNLYFNIKEGDKIEIKNIKFIGNENFSSEELTDLYFENATTIADRGFLDKNYLKTFMVNIRKKYLQSGFVFVSVSDPKLVIDKHSGSIDVEIREGQRCRLVEIEIRNVPYQLQKGILNTFTNKTGNYLDVLEFPNDLSKIVKFVRNEGYYFASIANLNNENILQYSDDFSEAKIFLDFKLERKAVLDTVVITGNSKTRLKVIKREVHLERGDIITPNDVDEIWEKLTGLTLFSKIEISPFVTNKESDDDYYNVNLLIQVHEVDFGVMEISPGYRTDLGAKVSSFISYNNLSGMNRSVSLQVLANRKLDQSGLEKSRIEKEPEMFEGEIAASYIEPYLFKIPLEFSPEISASRKRYYNFDADIGKFSLSLSKNLTKYLNTSVKYQFETINQYNATDRIDNGYFMIGGVTGALAFDFRDSEVTPKKGAWFGLSTEYANPYFGSMNTGELEVNFIKTIWRNKFYIPYKHWVFASSVSLGVEKNLATTKDFIPSIKVFRLSGVDVVRGFDDDEINRVESGDEISNVIISDKAYFTNFKLEPRYYMTDSTVIGFFIDAGNVTVDKIDVSTLRYSTGITFKYITPVGSIDFDYGVKLDRKSNEALGKFHLSIGFF